MKRKTLWLLISSLSIFSLVLSSCAQPTASLTTAPAQETAAPTTVSATTAPTTAPATADKPKYGGTLVYSRKNDTGGFDQIYTGVGWENPQFMTSDRLLIGDWTRSYAGTNEFDWRANAGWNSSGVMEEVGFAAESWRIPDDQTIIYKIRQGIYFALNPRSEASRLVNGRELTADDVVFSIRYMYLNPKVPNAYNAVTGAGGNKVTDVFIDPSDPWTVVVKMTGLAYAFLEDISVKGVHLIAREVVEKYGDLKDWRNSVGTGGFMLTDYVPASSFTFVKNPDYWLKNPIGPGKGDQLPYVDGVKWLVIVDKATNLAAIRTGRIDTTEVVTYEDWAGVMKTNPQTQWGKALTIVMQGIGPNNYQVNNPLIESFQNRRVRWALSMAIDREAIIRDYYNGEATYFVMMLPSTSPYYTSFDQKVEILQKVFGMKPEEAAWVKKAWEYHPDEARKILAEEGYPNGFKTKVMLPTTEVEWVSIMADYWAKIGVQLELDPRETVTYNNIRDAHTYPGLQSSGGMGAISTNPAKWVILGLPKEPTGLYPLANYWHYWDPIVYQWQEETNAVFGDLEKSMPLFQEIEAYIAWNMHSIAIPGPTKYHLWQPWLKNYYGFYMLGFRGHYAVFYYSWVDQDLKKKMGR